LSQTSLTNSIPHTGTLPLKKASEPFEKFADWERFQNLASNLISPRIEINSGVEADKAALEITASITLA
jgi:hypothetical protein